MKVFVSWSGDRSRTIATAIADWLPKVFQGLEVFVSDESIHAGASWGSVLTKALDECRFGVICLTPENLGSLWLMFEAGALSKALGEESRVVPYLFQLEATDVGPPLSSFQGVPADTKGTFKLIRSLNDALGNPLKSEAVERETFDAWWPQLEKRLAAVPGEASKEVRPDRELLEEILLIVRQAGIRDLNQRLALVLRLPGVERVELAPKVIADEEQPILAIRITVAKKLPARDVPPDEVIPGEIFGMPTDVIEARHS